MIINFRFTILIAFHDVLYGFRACHSTGTASLEAKLIQQLMAMGEEFMYAIVLDLHKVYDTLDRDRWLDILEGYSVGPLDCRILRAYWYRIGMMYCAGGY